MPPAVFAYSPQFERALAAQIILLAPMAPSFASELWSGFVSAPNRLNENEFRWDKMVLEQKWPEIDSEYKVDLVCEVSKNEICVVKIAKKDLDVLTEQEAVRIALERDEVKSALDSRNVLRVEYKKYEGCEAVVNVVPKYIAPVQEDEVKVSDTN